MNQNYTRGRRKEYKICKALRKDGYDIVQRSAGSHSPVDVWAISKEDKKILLVQSKPDSMSYKEKDKIEEEYKWLNGYYDVEFKVV